MRVEQILAEVKNERDRVEKAIAALEGTTRGWGRTAKASGGRRRRHMSAAARKRISEAMKARWASGKMKGRRKRKA